MKRLNRGRVPPGDGVATYHYPQGAVVIHGNTREELVRNIFEYRMRNGLAIGDIEADVDAYYCAKWPGFCNDSEPGTGKPPRDVMLNRVTTWVAGAAQQMPRGGYEMTAADEAERRAAICTQCRKNTAWKVGCAGCSSVTSQLILAVKKNRKTSRDGSLMACEVGSWENGAAAHLPVTALPLHEALRAELPDECWRKALT